MAASKEVWGKLFGTINTREKFEAHRLTLAQHEWARLKANNSLECRNCHGFDYSGIHASEPARGPGAFDASRQRRTHLHRLPQEALRIGFPTSRR